jgi:glycine cleavage system H protein
VQTPEELRYSAEHEWARLVDGEVTVGITDFAQDSLGDVVFVALPAVGDALGAGDSCGEVESTKSVSDVYTPVPGTVVAVNERLADEPELINQDPYGDGWMFRIRPDDAAALDSLMDADAYRSLTEA